MKNGPYKKAGALTIVAISLASCSGTFEEPIGSTAPSEPPVSWEAFKDSVYQEPWEGGVYLVDGDIPLRDEQDLREYYDSWSDTDGALTVDQVFGTDNLWPFPDRFKLTYCISDAFNDTSQKDEVIEGMASAAASWHDLVAVRFVYTPSEDDSCDQSNSNVVFDVRPVPSDGATASAFFPDYARSQRSLRIRPAAFTTTAGGRDFEGILRHELGHAVGFRHEHIWLEPTCTSESTADARAVTSYDVGSVMHYPQCRPSGTGGYRQTASDYRGSIRLYGLAPALVLSITG